MENVEKKEAVDYVDPDIGAIGHLLKATIPVVSLPHGMLQVYPVFTPGIKDRYLADKIYGFHFLDFSIMAASGVNESGDKARIYSSSFDHDLQNVSPYYYSVLLEDYNIRFEYSVTHMALYSRMIFDENSDSNIIIGLNQKSSVEIVDFRTVKCTSRYLGISTYMYMELSKPFDSHAVYSRDTAGTENERFEEEAACAVFRFSAGQNEYIDVRIGISYISCEQAIINLNNEIVTWDFDLVKSSARNTWNNALNRIQVNGGSEKQKVIFYTALYRSLLRPHDISEYGRYFSGYDGKVHETGGYDFYVADGTWDSYRSRYLWFTHSYSDIL